MPRSRTLGMIVLVVFLTSIVVTGISTAQTASAPDCSTVSYNGDGTEANPYEISNVDELQCIKNQSLTANYMQVSDINASVTESWNGGDGFKPIGGFFAFTGTFDGNRHTITSLTIERSSEDQVGLFGLIASGAEITNVDLRNIDIAGNGSVGGLVGSNFNSTVNNSHVTGNVTGNDFVGGVLGTNTKGKVTESNATANVTGSGTGVGGLVGNSDDGTIEKSYSTGNVTGSSTGVGGLVGKNDDGIIEKSYSTGNVTGNSRVGGLVGQNGAGGIVLESYATGRVSGSDNDVGGLVGDEFSGTVIDSYWDTETTGQSSSQGGTGLTTSEMTGSGTTSNMTGFDFTNTWETVTNPDDYPILMWQTDKDDFTKPLPVKGFTNPPTNTGELHPTLYEDLDGDGDGKDVAQTVSVFGELIRGKDLGLTDEQARKLNWNDNSPETEVTVADMVTLFGEQIRSE